MIFDFIDFLILLYFKFSKTKLFLILKYIFRIFFIYYIVIYCLLSWSEKTFVKTDPFIIFSYEAFEYCAKEYAVVFTLFLILYIIGTTIAFYSIIVALKTKKQQIVKKTLAEVALYWLPKDKLELAIKERPQIKYSIMNAKDIHVYSFANVVFKPLVENRSITAEEGLVIEKIIDFLQDAALKVSSVSSFNQDPNTNYKKNDFSTGKTYHDVFQQISLLDHSLHVAKNISEDENVKTNFRLGLAIIAALSHDLGKINLLESSFSWTDNNNFKKLIANKKHQEISSLALKQMLDDKLSLDINMKESLVFVYQAIELHHTPIIEKEILAENVIIQALKDADKKARQQELEWYAKEQIRTIAKIEEEYDFEKYKSELKDENKSEKTQEAKQKKLEEKAIKNNDKSDKKSKIAKNINKNDFDEFDEEIEKAVIEYNIPEQKEKAKKELVRIGPKSETVKDNKEELLLEISKDTKALSTINIEKKDLEKINLQDEHEESSLYLAFLKYQEKNVKNAKIIFCLKGNFKQIIDYISSTDEDNFELFVHSGYECIFTAKKDVNETKIKTMIRKSPALHDIKVVIFKLGDFQTKDDLIFKVNLTLENQLSSQDQVYTFKPCYTFEKNDFLDANNQKQYIDESINFEEIYVDILNELSKIINTYNNNTINSIAYKDTILFNELKFKNIIAKKCSVDKEQIDLYSNSFVNFLDKKGLIKYISTKHNYFSFPFQLLHNGEKQILKAIPIKIEAYDNYQISELNKRSNDEFLTKIEIIEGE